VGRRKSLSRSKKVSGEKGLGGGYSSELVFHTYALVEIAGMVIDLTGLKKRIRYSASMLLCGGSLVG